MNGSDALEYLLGLDFDNVLDVGSGEGEHAKILTDNGRQVVTISLREPCDILDDFNAVHINTDCIWACHVLEHQLNVNWFLKKCFADLNENGILAITVPPMKTALVGGHVTLWTLPLLVYNLVLAGFDCSSAWTKEYGYNISVVVRKKLANLEGLAYDNGDINILKDYFPFPVWEGYDNS